MKNILLLATGGTIAMKSGTGGLDTAFTSTNIAECIRELCPETAVDCKDILRLDSSNIQPEEWQVIARHIHANLGSYDGIIITHGTDTMAYTASAVSFMLRNVGKSVVFTGSQLPIDKTPYRCQNEPLHSRNCRTVRHTRSDSRFRPQNY